VNLDVFFQGVNNFRQRTSDTLFVRARQNLATLEYGQSKIIPEFRELLSGGDGDPVISCGGMH